jgi:hypothetical protein
MKFTVGASMCEEIFEIPEPFPSWRLIDYQPSCGTCGRQLHLFFDSPPKSGTASCKCEEEDGNNVERRFSDSRGEAPRQRPRANVKKPKRQPTEYQLTKTSDR